MCGSYCTYKEVFQTLENLVESYPDITPILSENAAGTDSRFGTSAEHEKRLEALCGRPVIKSIAAAEPIGPKKLLDALVIAPCTGNTLGKLACGITDTAVTMAAKAHLRNGRPLILALATNDGLAGSAPNLGIMLGRKNVYFVPFGQDDCVGKPTSLVADFSLVPETVEAACRGEQLQPVLLGMGCFSPCNQGEKSI